MIKMMNTMV